MVLFIPVYVLLVACLPLSRGHCLPDQPAKGGLQVRYGQTNVQYNSVVAVDRASAVPALHADVGNEAEQCSEMCFKKQREKTQTEVGDEGKLPEVTLQIVKEVCKTVSADECLPAECVRNIQDIDCADLQRKLKFLEGCLVKKGKFINAAKEKAWSNYYLCYITQVSSISEVTHSVQLSAFIALRVFQKLITNAYNQTKTTNTEINFREEEKGTVRYIGGCVVHKIKQRLWRLEKTSQRDEKLLCLDAMCQSKEDSATAKNDMTSVLDRGGLIYIKPNIAELFYNLEQLFRCIAGPGSDIQQVSCADFVDAAVDNMQINSYFYDSLYHCTVQTNILEEVLEHILQLYFKIRIHHKLKTLMDKIRAVNYKSKMEKGLRKKIKAASTASF